MKKLLAIIIAASFAMPAFALDKAPAKAPAKAAPAKKVVKKHKKFEGTTVPTPAPKAPAKKAAPAKKK